MPKRETLKERITREKADSYSIGFSAGVNAEKNSARGEAETRKMRRLQIIQQTQESLSRAIDAMAHALQFVTKEGTE